MGDHGSIFHNWVHLQWLKLTTIFCVGRDNFLIKISGYQIFFPSRPWRIRNGFGEAISQFSVSIFDSFLLYLYLYNPPLPPEPSLLLFIAQFCHPQLFCVWVARVQIGWNFEPVLSNKLTKCDYFSSRHQLKIWVINTCFVGVWGVNCFLNATILYYLYFHFSYFNLISFVERIPYLLESENKLSFPQLFSSLVAIKPYRRAVWSFNVI